MRAQRSNPESFRGGSLDCFAALAMTACEAAPSLPKCRLMPPPSPGMTAFSKRTAQLKLANSPA
ncbi:hypothetical protein FXB38_30235 [Bradyrhizobium cytisi]|uniref:Uncharacterized protein n=1 Tax=Bradyrhizobium cytisi TaxID=515489 RepID=A0A5S4WCZ5_9BRAD|nr:hypothetical protein FXB38_30235 [Bradyrhizobium cytisi]